MASAVVVLWREFLAALKKPRSSSSEFAVWATLVQRRSAPPAVDMFRLFVSFVLLVSISLLVWHLTSAYAWPLCSLFKFVRDDCPCSPWELVNTSVTFSLYYEIWVPVQLVSILPTLMGCPNRAGQAIVVVTSFLSLHFAAVMPSRYLYIPIGVTFGFHLSVQFVVFILVTSRVGPWKDWRRSIVILSYLVGCSVAAGVVTGGQQVLYLLFPGIVSTALTFVPLVLAAMESLWVAIVGFALDRDPSVTPEVAAALARIITSAMVGLRAGLQLSAIHYSPSLFDGPFIEALTWGVVLQVLGRNKVFTYCGAKLLGKDRMTTEWSNFEKICNGVKYDVNYSATAVVIMMNITHWAPVAYSMGCDGQVLQFLRPELKFIVAMIVGDVVTDLLSFVLTKSLQHLATWRAPPQTLASGGRFHRGEYVSSGSMKAVVPMDSHQLTLEQEQEESSGERTGSAIHHDAPPRPPPPTPHYSQEQQRNASGVINLELVSHVAEELLDTSLFFVPASRGDVLLTVASSLSMGVLGIVASLQAIGKLALTPEEEDKW